MTMNPDDAKGKKAVLWMGEIPPGQDDKFRYPTEEEVEIALYEMETLTEEEYFAMTDEEREIFYKKSKKIVKQRMNDNN